LTSFIGNDIGAPHVVVADAAADVDDDDNDQMRVPLRPGAPHRRRGVRKESRFKTV
jgi:hypothetical protein